MRTVVVLFFLISSINAHGQKWEARVYWNYSNLNFFNEDIVERPHYIPRNREKRELNEINKEETYIAGDSLIIYLYRNRQKSSFGGVMSPASKKDTYTFLDSSFLDNSSPFLATLRLTIQLNDSFLLKNESLDSLLLRPSGSGMRMIEVIKMGNEQMLLLKYHLTFQDSLRITTTDRTGKTLDDYRFYHIDPYPRIIKRYDLNEKYTFQEILLKRDSLQQIQQDLPFESDHRITVKPENNDILLLLRRYAGADTLAVQYQLLQRGITDAPWREHVTDIPILQFTNLKPGKQYILNVRYNLTPYAQNQYVIEIEQYWWQINWVQWLIAFFGGGLVIGIGWLFYKTKKVRHLRLEEGKRKQLDIQIRTVRSQLNPHFLFNALASIQSLINKNQIMQANQYLVRLSHLLRNTLEHSNQIMVTIADEIKMLKNYIEIEKLRFDFTSHFATDDKIPQHEVELPSMLLQPIVENAIKHGINGVAAPCITIRIFGKGKSLFIQISDNGKGFDLSQNREGFGLKLTKERIQLLNQYLIGTPIELNIDSRPGAGSHFTFTLKDWL